MIFTWLVTMDSIYSAAIFTYNYVKQTFYPSSPAVSNNDVYEKQKNLIDTYTHVFKATNTADRILYYAGVQVVFSTAWYCNLIHYDTFFVFILLLHTPPIFNTLLYPKLHVFFDTLVHERIQCGYFILYKQIKSMFERTTKQKVRMNLTDLDEPRMDLFLKHYLMINFIMFLREKQYFFYKFFKYCYLYRYEYKLDALTPSVAMTTVNDLVIMKSWEKVSEPKVVHALISIASKEKMFEKMIIYSEYKLIEYFCVLTVSEIVSVYGLIAMTYLFEFYQLDWKLQLRKVLWLIIGCLMVHYLHWYWIGCFIAMINDRFVDNFITRTTTEFILQRMGYAQDTVQETHGWIHVS